jgi:hypothetical protein
MLVLQCTPLLVGAYHLLARAMPARPAAIAATGLLWFPPVAASVAVIEPASLLTAFLVAGAVAIASERRLVQLAGLALLLLACGLRSGAAAAVLPIVVLGLGWRTARPAWQRALIGLAIWAVLALGAAGLRAWVTDGQTRRNELALATSDIGGVLRFAGRMSDDEVRASLAGLALTQPQNLQRVARRLYTRSVELTAGPDRLFDPPTSARERSAVLAARKRLMRAHPFGYLRYRVRVLGRVLGLPPSTTPTPLYIRFTEDLGHRQNLQFAATYSHAQRMLVTGMRAVEHSFLFHAYLYFALAIILLPLALVRRARVATMLLASALAYTLALMIVTVSPAPRDTLWLITGAVGAVILLIAQPLSARATRPR